MKWRENAKYAWRPGPTISHQVVFGQQFIPKLAYSILRSPWFCSRRLFWTSSNNHKIPTSALAPPQLLTSFVVSSFHPENRTLISSTFYVDSKNFGGVDVSNDNCYNFILISLFIFFTVSASLLVGLDTPHFSSNVSAAKCFVMSSCLSCSTISGSHELVVYESSRHCVFCVLCIFKRWNGTKLTQEILEFFSFTLVMIRLVLIDTCLFKFDAAAAKEKTACTSAKVRQAVMMMMMMMTRYHEEELVSWRSNTKNCLLNEDRTKWAEIYMICVFAFFSSIRSFHNFFSFSSRCSSPMVRKESISQFCLFHSCSRAASTTKCIPDSSLDSWRR